MGKPVPDSSNKTKYIEDISLGKLLYFEGVIRIFRNKLPISSYLVHERHTNTYWMNEWMNKWTNEWLSHQRPG